MFDYRNVIKNRELRLKLINLLRFIPTKPYLKMVYKIKTGKKLNLKNPTTFNEKLQWIKLYDRRPEYTRMVDKYEVRGVIADAIGEEYLFPLLGVWDNFDDIDFEKLPDRFVLKCTHDSGSIKIIKDKKSIDYQELRKFFTGRLKINPYIHSREYPYKNVKPRIIAEQYMEDADTAELRDYKFYCFDGYVKALLVATNRQSETEELSFDYFDGDYQHLDLTNHWHPHAKTPPQKPDRFDEMKQIAQTLSKGIPHVRIDLYEVNGKVYFGEFTFFDAGGFLLIHPDSWGKEWGDLIKLNL